MISHRSRQSVVKKAFTLIELLVVISIIALLIGILLPALSSARDVARRAQCLSNQRQIGIAMMTYSTTNKGFLPYCYYHENGEETRWWHRLQIDGAAVGSTEEGGSSNLVCPVDDKPYTSGGNVFASYGMNQFTSISDGVTASGSNTAPDGKDGFTPNQPWYRVDQMLSPSELLLISEIYYGHLFETRIPASAKLQPWQKPLVGTNNELTANLWNIPEWGRHASKIDDPDGAINVLYTDGHAEPGGRGTDVVGTSDAQTIEEFDKAKRLFWPQNTNPADG